MELSTLQLCRAVIRNLTLKVGANDFPEIAPIVLTALTDLDEAIHEWENPLQAPDDVVFDLPPTTSHSAREGATG